jgi:hypothetical protein
MIYYNKAQWSRLDAKINARRTICLSIVEFRYLESIRYLRYIDAITMKLAYFSKSGNSIVIGHRIIQIQGIRMFDYIV